MHAKLITLVKLEKFDEMSSKRKWNLIESDDDDEEDVIRIQLRKFFEQSNMAKGIAPSFPLFVDAHNSIRLMEGPNPKLPFFTNIDPELSIKPRQGSSSSFDRVEQARYL